MSIESRITAMTEHIGNAYDGLTDLGVDLTNVDKNINNIKACLDSVYNDYPKTEYGEDLAVTLENTKKAKLTMIPEGNNTQFTTTGKNLWKVGYNASYSTTINGVKFTVNNDGSITVNGLASANAQFYLNGGTAYNGTIVAGTYTFSGSPSGYGTSTFRMQIQLSVADDTGTQYISGEGANGNTRTLTSATNTFRSYIIVYSGYNAENLIFRPQFEVGSSRTDFEPYTAGASPNPSFPQIINRSTGNNKVFINNSNWFSSELELGTIGNNNGVPAAETRAVRSKDFIAVAPNTRYCISNDKGYANYTYEYDKNQKFLKFTSSNSQFSFVTMEQTRYVKFRTVASREENDLTAKFMLNLGLNPLTWVAYSGQELPLNLSSKNLFTGLIKGKVVDAVTGVETANATGSVSDFIRVDFKDNSKYYLSGLTDTLNSFVAGYNKYGVFVGRTGGGARTELQMAATSFTQGTPQGTGDVEFIRVVQQWVSGNTGTIDDIDNLQVQLEVGTAATTYEPYWSYELNGIDTYKDQLFKNIPINPLYNSELTLGSWYKLNKIEEIKLKDISFTLSTTFTNVVRARGNLSPKSISTPNGLCNAFTFLANYSSDEEHFYIQDTAIWLFINKSRLDAITDKGIKDFIDANNFYAMGVLDTQTYTEITQTSLINQLDAIDKAQGYNGTTVISSSAEDYNVQMTMKARALKGA